MTGHCGYRWKSGTRCLVTESHPIHHGGWEKVHGLEPDHDYLPESHEWSVPMCRWCGKSADPPLDEGGVA